MADGRFALILACSRYTDATLTQLQAPGYDAESLARVLADPAIGDFDLKTLIDRPAVDSMQELEAFFDGRRRNDLLLVYFSGHGILDQNARLYFATTDTRVDRPRSTAIPAALVNDLMSECRSRRQVLVLDCCNSGSFARGVKAGGKIGTRERFEGRGRVVITASDALQYAFESGQIEGEGVRSVFTEALVEGLKTGEADLDGDGYVTPDELYDYVYSRVVDASPRQRPGKWSFGVEGQIFIAQTTPARTPGPSPREISASPKPVIETQPGPRSKRLRAAGRRRAILAGAALAAAAAIAAALILLTRGTPPARTPPSSAGRTTAPSAVGTTAWSHQTKKQAAFAVYHTWLDRKLATLRDYQISPNAKTALGKMPTGPRQWRPVTSPCWEDGPETVCAYEYSDLGFELQFHVDRGSGGPRVETIECRNSTTSKIVNGGIAACRRLVQNS
jgi:Caspase domain